MERSLAHERQFASTPAGARAQELRTRAQKLQGLGEDEQAFLLFREAVQCFAADADGPAAAAAYHDLGEAYRDRLVGSRLENLQQAEHWLRRAYASPARAEDQRRLAMTANSLASALRHRAMLTGQDTDPLLREAVALLGEAIRISETFGPAFGNERARFLDTLGNLHLQRGELDESLRLNRKAVAAAMSCVQMFPDRVEIRQEWATFKCHLIRRLIARGRRADLREALFVAEALRREVPDGCEDLLDLCMAEALQAIGGPKNHEKARDLLMAIRVEGIPAPHFYEYVDLLAKVGRRDHAIQCVRNALHDAVAERSEARADYLADHASARVYEAGRRLADLLLAEGDTIEAFLALENSSGLRYEDALQDYAAVATTPVGRALEALEVAYRTTSAMIEDLAGVLGHASNGEQHVLLTDLMANDHIEQATSDSPAVRAAVRRLVREELPAALEQALAAGDRGAVLKKFSDELASRAFAVQAALEHHEPNFEKHPGRLGFAVGPDDLRRIFDDRLDSVLMRVALDGDVLLVIAVFTGGDGLTARSVRIAVPEDLLAQVWKVAAALPDISNGKAVDHLAAVVSLTATVASIDLSPVFPEGINGTLVMLPDAHAALLPLGAFGPAGATPIARFAAVTWLPCLGPLRCRQVATRQRTGQMTVVPFPTLWPAEEEPLAEEEFLWDEEASHPQLMASAGQADVLCMLTHCMHEPGDWPAIELRDGLVPMLPFQGPMWAGLERVEVWACESGVGIPGDPRSTMTNEFFGADGILLQHGVRSTIGTLWQVSDRITGEILRRYRSELRAGLPADRALVAAQRWWIGVGIDEWLADHPERAMWRAIIASPTFWAGYRFSGVCERRPERSLSADAALSEADEASIGAVLESLDRTGESLTDLLEHALDELDVAVAAGRPTSAQALRAARLYRARLLSSYGHNQLCALAWLHEAIGLAGAEERPELVREAARLWAWFALRETPEAIFLAAQGPSPERTAARLRAEQLLGELDPAECAAERGMLAVLAAIDEREPETLARIVAECCAELAPAAMQLDLGALAISCWIAASDVEAAGTYTATLLAAVSIRTSELSLHLERIGDASLISWTGRLLARVSDRPPPVADPELEWLPAPMLCAAAVDRVNAIAGRRDGGGKAALVQHSEAMTDLEGRLWDHPRGDGERLWRSTGSAGAAYRRLAGWYLRGVANVEAGDRYASVFTASLQFFADLRLLVWNRLAQASRLAGGKQRGQGQMFANLRVGSMIGEQQMQQLAAVAGIPASKGWSPLDPFVCTPEAVHRRFHSVADLPVWELAEFEKEGPEDPRTLAFRTVRKVEEYRRETSRLWTRLREAGAAGPLWQLLSPSSDIAVNQRVLAELPTGTGLLACMVSPTLELILTASWRAEGAVQRRVMLRGDRLGMQVTHLAVALSRPQPPELDGVHGPAFGRGGLWAQLHGLLAPLLTELLAEVPDGLKLAVFAPGGLRPLPWLACMPARVLGVWQVPALGWLPVGATRRIACWFDPGDDPTATRDGATIIGELRALWQPDAVLGVREHRGRDIPEAHQLERVAATTGLRLRIYGLGFADGITDREAGLRLSNQRAFVERNLANTIFGPGTEVELWAATPCLFGGTRCMLDDGDRIPGLTHGLLGAGATAVLDLAWPVHDLVKALVCEHFSLVRGTRRIEGAVALAAAVRFTGWLLKELTGSGLREHASALEHLDMRRRQVAQRLGVMGTIAPLPRAPAIADVEAWITELANPAHLAAFRWWGTCPLGPIDGSSER